jgi:hypothetical protein
MIPSASTLLSELLSLSSLSLSWFSQSCPNDNDSSGHDQTASYELFSGCCCRHCCFCFIVYYFFLIDVGTQQYMRLGQETVCDLCYRHASSIFIIVELNGPIHGRTHTRKSSNVQRGGVGFFRHRRHNGRHRTQKEFLLCRVKGVTMYGRERHGASS